MAGERVHRDIHVSVVKRQSTKKNKRKDMGGRGKPSAQHLKLRRARAPGARRVTEPHAHKSPLDPAQLLDRILRRLAQVVCDGQTRIRRQDDIDFADEALARMVQRQVLDRGHEWGEASQEVGDPLVLVRRGATSR